MKINLSPRRLGESLAWKLFPCLGLEFRTGQGVRIPVAGKSEMAIYKEIFVRREYDPFLDLIDAPRSVVDLGCNAGFFPLLLLDRARAAGAPAPGKVLMIDADPAMVERSREVATLNDLSSCEHLHGLVGSGEGAQDFHVHREGAESSAKVRGSRSRTIQVPVLPLAETLTAAFPGGVDLLKCDIEGGETPLVQDSIEALRLARAFLVEWHPFGLDWEAFSAAVTGAGFKLAREEESGRFKLALFLNETPPGS